MMRRMIRDLIMGYWRHPSESQLLAYHDNELPGYRRRRIMQHLNQCPECQDRSEQLARDWKNLTAMTAAAEVEPAIPEEELIRNIQASIRDWSVHHLPPSDDAVKVDAPCEVVAPTAPAGIKSIVRILLGRRGV